MFALLQRKTQVTYEEVIRVPEESGCDPSKVIIDFERPAELAMRVVFGEGVMYSSASTTCPSLFSARFSHWL